MCNTVGVDECNSGTELETVTLHEEEAWGPRLPAVQSIKGGEHPEKTPQQTEALLGWREDYCRVFNEILHGGKTLREGESHLIPPTAYSQSPLASQTGVAVAAVRPFHSTFSSSFRSLLLLSVSGLFALGFLSNIYLLVVCCIVAALSPVIWHIWVQLVSTHCNLIPPPPPSLFRFLTWTNKRNKAGCSYSTPQLSPLFVILPLNNKDIFGAAIRDSVSFKRLSWYREDTDCMHSPM